jgi:iron complex outermembrane receptor protein
MKKSSFYALIGSIATTLPAAASAQDDLDDLENLSLESLGNIVTSVSRKPEDSFRAAAAIYVITNDDIKASGATHIAEVFRGVPGLDVARFDSSNWAISSRGFNAFFTNKLLVQVDGRTIYTPWFSGVYWDIQNLPLEDVDRIEIIRGPGATQWGANAVNGIINIITKSASSTQGFYASTIVGTEDNSITDLRYGGKLNDDVYYRAYAKYDLRDDTKTVNNASGNNEWYNAKAGFRSDWAVSNSRKLTLQGDVYNAVIDLDLGIPSLSTMSGILSYHDEIHSKGMNLLGRWEETHSDTKRSTFQAYFDYQSPDYSSLKQDIYTFDFDYQTAWKANDRNDVMWGSGVRYINAIVEGSSSAFVTDKTESIFSAFLQDQIALLPKEVYLTLGSKLEHNTFSGFEVQPSARMAWYPDNKQTVWGAISRAVRTPSIFEGNDNMAIDILAISPDMVQQRGSRTFDSEKLIAYELGYRIKPVNNVLFDNTVFINDYDKLATLELGTPVGIYIPYYFGNLGEGRSYGFESSINWDVTSRWNLLTNYSYINMVLEKDPSSTDSTFLSQERKVPHHQVMVRSQVFLPHDFRLINTAYYVSKRPSASVDQYMRFDTQIIWKATENIELSFVGQNLLDDNHPEFSAPPDGTANEIPRAFYGRVTFRY